MHSQIDAALGYCRGPAEQIIDKVVDVIMQLEFQQSKVFVFVWPQNSVYRQVVDISVAHREGYAQCTLQWSTLL